MYGHKTRQFLEITMLSNEISTKIVQAYFMVEERKLILNKEKENDDPLRTIFLVSLIPISLISFQSYLQPPAKSTIHKFIINIVRKGILSRTKIDRH